MPEEGIRRSLVPALAAIALVAGTSESAAQREGRIQGGMGGRLFDYSCGEGRVLVGLRGSAGVLIDNIQAVCGRVDAAGGVAEASAQGPSFGNSRPQDQEVRCPEGHAVTRVEVARNNDHPHVGAIRLTCTELVNRADGGATQIEVRGTGNLEGYQSSFGLVGGDPGGRNRGASDCADGYANGIRGRAEDYLTAFGVLCGPKPSVAAVAVDPNAGHTLGKRKKPGSLLGSPFASLVNSDSSFQAYNFPDRFIRHSNDLGAVEPSMGNPASITFRVVPGLAGRCVSLQSVDVPGQFLRHQNWRLRLSPLDADGNMRGDATFCMVPGLASTTGVSFEAATAPGRFIRHRNFELWVDGADGSDQFRSAATFLAAPPGGVVQGVR